MKKLDIVKYPNPILESPAEVVQVPLLPEDLELVKDLFCSVQEIGIGLAAPQVGVGKKIFIIHLSEDEELSRTFKTPDFVVINPKIIFYSEKTCKMIEGCLSFPDQWWENERPQNIKVKFDTIYNLLDVVNNNAEPKYGSKEILMKDWISRIFQHEYDHLEGKIFTKMGGKQIDIDKLKGEQRIVD